MVRRPIDKNAVVQAESCRCSIYPYRIVRHVNKPPSNGTRLPAHFSMPEKAVAKQSERARRQPLVFNCVGVDGHGVGRYADSGALKNAAVDSLLRDVE
jgi:hypothetical protein